MHAVEMADAMQRSVSGVKKAMVRLGVSWNHEPIPYVYKPKGWVKESLYTRHYKARLFEEIKRIEREIGASGDMTGIEHLNNMKAEYRDINCDNLGSPDIKRFKYSNISQSVSRLWKPIVKQVNY